MLSKLQSKKQYQYSEDYAPLNHDQKQNVLNAFLQDVLPEIELGNRSIDIVDDYFIGGFNLLDDDE